MLFSHFRKGLHKIFKVTHSKEWWLKLYVFLEILPWFSLTVSLQIKAISTIKSHRFIIFLNILHLRYFKFNTFKYFATSFSKIPTIIKPSSSLQTDQANLIDFRLQRLIYQDDVTKKVNVTKSFNSLLFSFFHIKINYSKYFHAYFRLCR